MVVNAKSPGTETVWWCHASVEHYFRFQKRTKKSLTTFSLKSDYKYFPQLRYYLIQFGKSYYVVSKRRAEGALEGLKTNFSALHLGGHGSSELLLFKSQWFRCHQRFQRDCIWSLCRIVINLRIHGHYPDTWNDKKFWNLMSNTVFFCFPFE